MSQTTRLDPRHTGIDRPLQHGRLLLIASLLSAFTSSWTGFRVSGLNLTDFFLVGALVIAVASELLGRVSLRLSWQFSVLPVVGVLLMARDALVLDRLPFQTLTAAQYTSGDSLGETVGGSATFLARLLLSWTLVAIAASAFRDRPHRLVWLSGAWVAGAVVSAAWAVVQSTSPAPDLPFLYHVESATRALGLSNHPNSLAETISATMPLLIFVAAGGSSRIGIRLLGTLGAAVGLWALFLSGSRAGLLMGFLALIGSLLIRLRWSGKAVWGLPIVLLGTGAGIVFLPHIWSTTRFSSGGGQLSDIARLQALKEGFGLFLAHPVLGGGLSTWLGEMVPLILLSGGGLALFFVFYASLGTVLLRVWRARSRELLAHLAWSGAVVLLFGLLNNGIVERYLYWPFILGFFLVLAKDAALTDRGPSRSIS